MKPAEHANQSPEQQLREMERRLQEREAELEQRNHTVRELTARLSKTAEKLDRIQRVGTDQIKLETSVFPKEVVEQQTELVGDLKRAVEMWETMQLGCGLGKLEMQLSDLSDLFEEHFKEPEPEQPEEAELDEVEEFAEEANEPAEDEDAGIDEIEGLLEAELSEEPFDEEPVDPPEILDLADAGDADLRRCVQQQEAYIEYLSARLQRVSATKTSVEWEVLAADSEQITSQLEFTATKIEEGRRFAEFEMALQQTRLKRREEELLALTRELEQQMHNVSHNDQGEAIEEDASGQRWLRMLGVGKKGN